MKPKFLVGTLCLFVSCSQVSEMVEPTVMEITITAGGESYASTSKTLLQSSGAVYWTPGDAISLFFNEGTEGGSKFVSQATEVESVSTFKGSISNVSGGGEDFIGTGAFWGVYPYSAQNSCDGKSVILEVQGIQTGLAESFAPGMFPTIALSKSLEMAFYNVCGGVKFSVQNEGIKSVKFKTADGGVIAGKVSVSFDEDNRPAVVEVQEGVDEIILNAPNEGTFEVGQHYYIVSLPAKLDKGFTLTFYKDDYTEAEIVYDEPVTVKRSVFGVLENADKNVTEWKNSDESGDSGLNGNLESGLYIGVIGFNENLYKMPIRRLTYNSMSAFNGFIDGLTTTDGTLLYYAADNAVSALVGSELPEDLFSVAMVTFTDGLDQGSLMKNWDFETDEEYLMAINSRFYSEKVSGVPITAYSIGVRGNDVADIESFQNNLSKLSAPSYNKTEVTSMSEIMAKFEYIADELSKTINEQAVSLKVPGKATGTKFRFTFDDVADASDSRMYIEGVMNRREGTLSELVYVGLSSTSGEVVSGNLDGIFFNFTFEGIRTDDGELISENNIKEWTYVESASLWQINSEFTPAEDSEVLTETKSAAIMLVLDCSTSLGDDITLVKEAAKSFVSRLYNASADPLAVAAVTVNKSSMDLLVGQSERLNVSVMPETAADRNVIWASNNTDVATVDMNGLVVARSSGESMIYATSASGNKTATCKVSVVQKAQSISLDRSYLVVSPGKDLQLTATVLPEGTSDPSVRWACSDTLVATVDQNGKVHAIKSGKAKIYARTSDGTALTAVCFLTVKEDVMEEFPNGEMFSLLETSYDACKIEIRMPSSVKESAGKVNGGRAIRYNFTDLALYNDRRNNKYDSLDDYQLLLLNGQQFLRKDALLEFSPETITKKDVDGDGVLDTDVEDFGWNPILPGQPLVFFAGEFEWMQIPESHPTSVPYSVNGFSYPYNWDPGYYLPCLDSAAYFGSKGARSVVADISDDMDSYWTGAFQKKVFRAKEPDVMDSGVAVTVKWTTDTDAGIEFIPEDGVDSYCYGILSDAEYLQCLALIEGKEEYLQWFTTSAFAYHKFDFSNIKGNHVVRLSDSSRLKNLMPGTKCHVLVTALGNEKGTAQSFLHRTFVLTPSEYPAPEIEVKAVPESCASGSVVFNVRNTNLSSPITEAYYAANYVREWVKEKNSGKTYAGLAKENPFTKDQLSMINSENGLNITIPGIDGECMRMAVIGYDQYKKPNEVDEGTPAVADCEIPYLVKTKVSSPLLDTDVLVGEWQATARLDDGTSLSSVFYILRSLDYEESIPQEVMDVYHEVTSLSDSEIYSYYNEFKSCADEFNAMRLRGQNRLLVMGHLNKLQEHDVPLMRPYDLFVAKDYNAVDVQQVFFDFGPKYFMEVKQNGSVVMIAKGMNGLPVTRYGSSAYLYAVNSDFFTKECEFEVSVSDDNMSMTIHPYEDASRGLLYPNNLSLEDYYNSAQNLIVSEITLIKKSSAL